MYYRKFAVGQLFLASFLLAVSIVAQAQPDVTVGNATTQPGATVTVPVSFTNNGAVVGFNFDITYDNTVITAVDLSNCTGNNMNPGGVTCNSPSAGTISIAVATFPLANIASTQIGTIDFTISGTAALAPTTLTVANASFSDASAAAVSAGTLTNGTITVQAAPAPSISVTPATQAFTAANGSTDTKTITVTNDGNADGLTVTAALSGADASKFSIVSGGNTCPTAAPGLAQSATCTIQVQFAPDAVASFSASLDLTGNGGTANVALTGTGTLGPAGAITITPAGTFDFGELLRGVEEATQVFTVTNTGAAGSVVTIGATALTPAELGSPYTFAADSCTVNLELEKNESCAVTVKFAPLSTTEATRTLTVTGTDGNSTALSDSAAMKGIGIDEARPTSNPAAGTSAASQSEIVGPEGSNDFTVVWGNAGNVPYDLSCALSGSDTSNVWSLADATATVAADGSHTVTTTCALPDTETYTETLTCTVTKPDQETLTYTHNYECVGLPPLPVPVDNKWALALLALMMLMAASFGFRFIARQ